MRYPAIAAINGAPRVLLGPTKKIAQPNVAGGWLWATTAMSGGTAKGHAPHCTPKAAVSTPLHLPLSTRLGEVL
jgi:hypothetical protein